MDPREEQDGATREVGPVEVLEDVPVDLNDLTRVVKIGNPGGEIGFNQIP